MKIHWCCFICACWNRILILILYSCVANWQFHLILTDYGLTVNSLIKTIWWQLNQVNMTNFEKHKKQTKQMHRKSVLFSLLELPLQFVASDTVQVRLLVNCLKLAFCLRSNSFSKVSSDKSFRRGTLFVHLN